MANVDSRIVTMKFDNAQFEQGAKTTMHTMDQLSKSMSMPGASAGLHALQASVDKFSFGNMEGGITKISGAFMALSTVAITALSNITTQVMASGSQLVKSFTIDPINAGLKEYETNLNSVQTIMANTASQGTNLEQVTAALDELNEYSDKTIYNFSEMARNIGTFTAAGVDLDTSVGAIKGIANLAATSGSSAEQASTAMYQLSQALASGTVRLMDWNSVQNAGMGGAVFQDALKETARVHGVAVDDLIKKNGSFRDSLQEGWLSAEIMTETLSKFTGDLSRDQLKQMGYTEEQIDGIIKMGQTAVDAATKIKTFTQLMGALKESAGSGWAKTWQIVLGDFEEAKELWTGVYKTFDEMLGASADARNRMLDDWKRLGGRTALIDAVKNAFEALMAVIKPIKDAFRDIFPPMLGSQLRDISFALRDFSEKLKISDETAENLKRTFRGVFAVFHIIWAVIKGVAGVIGDLIGALFSGDGGFLRMTGNVGDFLVKVDELLTKGDFLKKFFEALGAILSSPIVAIKALTGFIMDLFGSFGGGASDKAGGAVDAFKERLGGLGDIADKIMDALGGLGEFLRSLFSKMQPFFDWIKEAFGSIGDALGEAFSGGDFSMVFDALNTGLFAGLVLMFKKFFAGGIFGKEGNIFESITGSFNALQGTLESMQANVQADTLMKIAIAVGILAAAIVVLSLIDSEKLKNAMVAITISFTELMIALKILEKVSGTTSVAKMVGISTGLILLATAILILASAVKKMGELSWSELTKGLLGIAGILLILRFTIKPLSDNAGQMIKAAAGIFILGLALKVLADAVGDFAAMDLATTGKGMGIISVALIGIAGAMRLMPKGIRSTAAAIGLLALALKVIAAVIKDLGALSWEEIGRGLAGIAGALGAIALAMRLMPKNMLMQAASLIVVGLALQIIGKAVASMGELGWDAVARGLVTLGGSLLIIAVALNLMSGTLAGAAALIIAAGALFILAGVLKVLGSMKIGEIVTGLIALAAIFVILGVAGYLLAPVVPIILGLGIAIAAIGAGMLFAGLGVLAFVTALTLLVALGSAAALAIGAILTELIKKIPEAMRAFGEGIIAFADAISGGYTAFKNAFVTIMNAILDTIIEEAPKIKDAIVTMLTNFLDAAIELAPKLGEAALTWLKVILKVLTEAIPQMADAGLKILLGLLNAIANNTYRLVTAGAKIITEFLRGIGDNAPKVMDEAAKTIIKFIDGLSLAIDKHSEELGKAGGRLVTSIVKGMVKGFGGAAGEIADAAKDAAKGALDAAMNFLGAHSPSTEFMKVGQYADQGFALGITRYSKIIDGSIIEVGESAVDTMKKTLSNLSDLPPIDINPVITPVLDLTQVEKEAQKLPKLLQNQALAIDLSYSQASAISADQLAKKFGEEEFPTTQASTLVQFEQNNYSPTALSHVEIYRQTRNQLSLAKEALKS